MEPAAELKQVFLDSVFRDLSKLANGRKLTSFLQRERYDTDAVIKDMERSATGKTSNLCRSVDDDLVIRELIELVAGHKCMTHCVHCRIMI